MIHSKTIAKAIAGLGLAFVIATGCKTYYQETGVAITAGDVSAPLEVSDAADIVTIRALYSMSGMRMWTSRGYAVYFDYNHTYTNSYLFGLVDEKGTQGGKAMVVTSNDCQWASALMSKERGR